MLLEPEHGFGVEVVRRLVEEEQVGLLEEELAQGHPAALTTGEDADVGVGRRAAQGVHGLFELGVEVPRVGGVDGFLELAHLLHQGVEVRVRIRHLLGDLVVPVELRLDLGHALFDVAEHGLVLIERRLLHEDADGVSGAQPGFAVRRLFEAGHDLEDRRLAGAVGADHADLRPGVEGHRHVVENDFVTVRFARLVHGVNEFGHSGPRLSVGHPMCQSI